MKFSFDDFVIDTEAYTLTRDGIEVAVELRVLETLAFLIRERHRVISKEELLETVWEVDFASESTLFKAIQQARKALGDDARNQRFIKTVHGKGYRFIAEVTESLDEPEPARLPQAKTRDEGLQTGKHRDNRWWVITIAASIVILIGLGWLMTRKTVSSVPSVRTSVAILHCIGDSDLGPDEAWMPEAVPELLYLRLRSAGGIRLLASDEVAAALRDLGWGSQQDNQDLDREAILDRLACDVAISSRLSHRAEGGLRIEATILRREKPHSHQLSQLDAEGDLFNLAGQLGRDLARLLGGSTAEQPWTPEVQPEAFARYVQGLTAFRDGDLNDAVSILAPLVAQRPRFVLARINLAKVYQSMGLKEAAGLEARTAMNFPESLPAETRLQLEALTLEIDGLWGDAAQIYRSLWSVAPDEVEYPLALIRALRWDGQSTEALLIGARVSAALEYNPRLHLELSRIYQIQGDKKKQRSSLEKAQTTAEARSATGRLASALLGLGWVDLSEKKLESAEEHFIKAEKLFHAIGNQRGEARCFKGHATALSYGPDPESSLPLFEQAAALQRQRGDFEDLAKTLYSTTGLLSYLGDFNGSLSSGREALEIALKTGDKEVEGAILTKIGDNLVDLGRPGQAMDTYLEALPILEEQGATQRIANLFNSMGLASEHTGDMAAAERHFRRSSEMWEELGDTPSWFNSAYNLAWLNLRSGNLEEATRLHHALDAATSDDSEKAAVAHLGAGIAYEAGDFTSAETMVGTAIDLREKTGEGAALESSCKHRLHILLETGRYEAVLEASRIEITTSRTDENRLGLVAGLLISAEALGQSGRWSEAQVQVEEALTIDETKSSTPLWCSANIISARVLTHLKHFEQAQHKLDQARQSAERSGLAMLVLEAEIEMAQLAVAQTGSEEARLDLVHLKRQAQNRGWGRLAR